MHPSKSPPTHIEPEFRIPLFKLRNAQDKFPAAESLAFTDEDFDTYFDRTLKHVTGDEIEVVRNFVRENASGHGADEKGLHPGVVSDLTRNVKKVRCSTVD